MQLFPKFYSNPHDCLLVTFVKQLPYSPYSYKFSRDVYFADITNSGFSQFYFHGWPHQRISWISQLFFTTWSCVASPSLRKCLSIEIIAPPTGWLVAMFEQGYKNTSSSVQRFIYRNITILTIVSLQNNFEKWLVLMRQLRVPPL